MNSYTDIFHRNYTAEQMKREILTLLKINMTFE